MLPFNIWPQIWRSWRQIVGQAEQDSTTEWHQSVYKQKANVVIEAINKTEINAKRLQYPNDPNDADDPGSPGDERRHWHLLCIVYSFACY